MCTGSCIVRDPVLGEQLDASLGCSASSAVRLLSAWGVADWQTARSSTSSRGISYRCDIAAMAVRAGVVGCPETAKLPGPFVDGSRVTQSLSQFPSPQV